jgi:hypothetical protein
MTKFGLLTIPIAAIAIVASLDLAGRSEGFALVHSFRTPGMFLADLVKPARPSFKPLEDLWLWVTVDTLCWLALFVAAWALVWKLVRKRIHSS